MAVLYHKLQYPVDETACDTRHGSSASGESTVSQRYFKLEKFSSMEIMWHSHEASSKIRVACSVVYRSLARQ